ncbi:hypothetical protein HHI36_022011 [Cryptolaemus montrouzieri]|uniref:Gustatory receptor n=1 Tax=Cryptolaemus montrouzieri TaxID=559131 RepID=A0ABD2MZV0_9CUCU
MSTYIARLESDGRLRKGHTNQIVHGGVGAKKVPGKSEYAVTTNACFYYFYFILVQIYSWEDLRSETDIGKFTLLFLQLVVNLTSVIFEFMLLVVTNELTSIESQRVTEKIQELHIQFGRHNLPYKSMELFILKTKINDSKPLVCGFFPLDWTLVYSMVAGISTYLVYLVQFREMEIDRKNSFL